MTYIQLDKTIVLTLFVFYSFRLSTLQHQMSVQVEFETIFKCGLVIENVNRNGVPFAATTERNHY